MSLKYEPASAPEHIYVKWWYLQARLRLLLALERALQLLHQLHHLWYSSKFKNNYFTEM